MATISVITPTIRPEGLRLVEKALNRQTFKNWEWIVSAPSHIKIKGFEIDQLLTDPPKNEGDYWSVYKSYNKMIRHAKGELIVSIQDHTSFDPDALEKFWINYQADEKSIISGVGNKYTDETFTVISWKDPREKGTGLNECNHNEIEWNFCAIPKEAIYSVGGFDEELDKYSSLCGLDVLDRLKLQGGWNFKLDQTNKSYSLEHGRMPMWEENLPFNGPYQEKLREYQKNCILPYLSKL
jgi:hypothetical protein